MKKLPSNISAYKKTPTFTKDTVPSGLLKTHTTKAGTWGKIQVLKGKLLYVIETDSAEEEEEEEVELDTNTFGVVEPEVPHHIKPLGEVEFYVEFYK